MDRRYFTRPPSIRPICFAPAGTRLPVVQVLDHGIGIPEQDRERLFERYFRGSNSTGIAGTGVGLHLVAVVVGLHQGTVFAESIEGVGSRFVVRLPLTPSQTPESTVARLSATRNAA